MCVLEIDRRPIDGHASPAQMECIHVPQERLGSMHELAALTKSIKRGSQQQRFTSLVSVDRKRCPPLRQVRQHSNDDPCFPLISTPCTDALQFDAQRSTSPSQTAQPSIHSSIAPPITRTTTVIERTQACQEELDVQWQVAMKPG
jgi:hypothetical protein